MSIDITDSLLKAYGLAEDGEELYKQIWATEVKYLSDHIGIRKVVDDNRIRIGIMVDSQTNKKDISDVWSEVRSERDKIVRIQGHDLSDYFQVVLDEIVGENYGKMVENVEIPTDIPIRQKIVYGKPQYRDLFMDANFDLSLFIIRISKKDQDRGRADLAFHYFNNLLCNYNYSQDARELAISATEEINNGRCLWDIYDGPIEFEKFINRIEYLVKICGKEIRNPLAKINMIAVYRMFVAWGDWKYAESLLKTSYPSTYEMYSKRLDARLTEILQAPT